MEGGIKTIPMPFAVEQHYFLMRGIFDRFDNIVLPNSIDHVIFVVFFLSCFAPLVVIRKTGLSIVIAQRYLAVSLFVFRD
jgi:hypothetical protein